MSVSSRSSSSSGSSRSSSSSSSSGYYTSSSYSGSSFHRGGVTRHGHDNPAVRLAMHFLRGPFGSAKYVEKTHSHKKHGKHRSHRSPAPSRSSRSQGYSPRPPPPVSGRMPARPDEYSQRPAPQPRPGGQYPGKPTAGFGNGQQRFMGTGGPPPSQRMNPAYNNVPRPQRPAEKTQIID